MKAGSTRNTVVIALGAFLLLFVGVIIGLLVGGKHFDKAESAAPNAESSQSGEPSADAKLPTTAQGLLDFGKNGEVATKVTDSTSQKTIAAEAKRKADDPRAKGKTDAPITMIEFGDFSCPMCARAKDQTIDHLQPLIDAGVLRIEWRDLSFFRQLHSEHAAIGGVAAARQGKFWEFHKAAYAKSANGEHPNWDPELVKKTAQEAGVPDMNKFAADLSDKTVAKMVEDETSHAQALGINGTPTFFINDYYVSGALPPQVFLATIRQALVDKTGSDKVP
ncbi:MAG: thioredoxin domain-containing protein [Actinomycetaceae bacterium]|nr:thioredoxin domain-containing protein [Actinomycetaceae bacterium]